VLTFTYVGFTASNVTISNEAAYSIRLSAAGSQLSDVVVTAHGITRNKKSLGYSTPIVEGDEVTRTQRENFINGLAGRVPGLQVNATSGQPGASSQIVLRGIVSLDGDNSPLMVIDGLPISNSTYNQTANAVEGTNRRQDYSNRSIDINPADIESYVILKGPEATALYGNMGASGAIVITTKKAKSAKGSVTYNNSFRVEKLTRFPEIQTVYNQGSNGVYANTINTVTGYRSYFGPKYAEGTPIFDNVKNFFETGFTQKHNLSFEGGNGGYTYRWSNEYTNQTGTIPNTSLRRLSTRVTGTAVLSPKMRLTSSFTYVNTVNRKANKGDRGFLISLLNFPSWYDARNYQDSAGNRRLTTTNGTIFNENDSPLWDVNKNFNEDKTNRFLANTNVSFRPFTWLNVQGALGADIESTNGVSVLHTQSYLGSGSATTPKGGQIEPYQALNRIINGSLTATATHKFKDFNNSYIIGTNFNDYRYQTDAQYGQNMYNPNFYSINNTLPTTQRTKVTLNRYRNFGVFAQSVLGYKTIAFLTLTGRMDAASRLMPGNPYFFYPAASFAFNFSDLKGMKEYTWLSSGKLRASYAYTGKEPRTPYVTLSRLTPQTSTGGGFAYSVTGGNSILQPEFTKNLELGTELAFLKNRLRLDFTWYNLKSVDQIVAPRLSYGTGFVLKYINGGTVTNKGIEVQLTGTPIKSKDLNWDVTVNFTKNRGTVTEVPGELPEFYVSDTWLADGVRSSNFKGASSGSLGGFIIARNNKGDYLIEPTTGRPILQSATDYLFMGDRTPDFSVGLNNNFSYKNFNLSFLLDFRKGGDVYNATEAFLYRNGLSTKTLDREVPRVIPGVLKDGLENTENPTRNNISILPYYNNAYYSPASELFVERDINWIRLRDITLQYTFPRTALARQKIITDLSVFVTGTDVFLITNYTGTDPDSNGNTAGVGGFGGYGIDFGNVGRPRGINFGLRLKL
jgi:TonB-linked SusC/RagA family outer membrane protein